MVDRSTHEPTEPDVDEVGGSVQRPAASGDAPLQRIATAPISEGQPALSPPRPDDVDYDDYVPI